MELEIIQQQVKSNDSKIILLIMDGLGGLPLQPDGLTELETAQTPNLDALAAKGICGLHEPIGAGLTPGSGPAHLGVFGYDPLTYQVGRGVLSAGGINFDLQPGDVAARGNFCTVDENGIITDRRAGRIPTEKGQELTKLLREEIKIPGVELFVETVKEYRYLLVLRGEGLSGKITTTDPQQIGKKPLPAQAEVPAAEKTAQLVQQFVKRAGEVLADKSPANMLTLRGFSQLPTWPTMKEAFGLRALGIAMYPMYRGVAKLVGMDVPPASHSVEEELEVLEKNWDDYDYFFFHVKRTDSAGEDGDFDRKVSIIEKVDRLLPRILALKPDVLVITGDHSTPAKMKSHSWHPVPVLLWSKRCRPDLVKTFGERACMAGALGPPPPRKGDHANRAS